MTTTAQPTLIYVGPYGFSGSTLLDTALAQSRDIFSLGEAFQIAEFARQDHLCTCHQRVGDCSLWSAILPSLDIAHLTRPETLSPHQDYLSRPLAKSAEVMAYAEEHWKLIDAVAAQTGVPIILDSSKHLWRLKALAALHPERIRFLHLLRDCGTVARSARVSKARPAVGVDERTPSVPYAQTVAKWILTNAAASRFSRNQGVAARQVRYEALVSRPEEILRDICGWIGVAFEPGMLHPSMDGLHNIAGSRWRMTKRKVSINPDRESLPPLPERLTSVFAAQVVAMF